MDVEDRPGAAGSDLPASPSAPTPEKESGEDVRARRLGPVATVGLDIILAAVAAAAGLLLGWPEFSSQGNLTVWYGAIAIGVFVALPRWRWWPYLVALVASVAWASRLGSWSPAGSAVRAATDAVIAVGLAEVLRRLRCIPFARTRDAVLFLLVVDVAGGLRSLVGPALSLLIPVTRGGLALPSINVGLSTVIGCVAVVPFVVLIADRRTWPPYSRRAIWAGTGAVLGMAALIAGTYFEPPGLLYIGLGFLVIPAFVVLAIRFSQLTVATALVVAVAGIAAGTARGWGPFAVEVVYPGALVHVILTVQLFLVSLPSGTWILVAALEEAERKRDRLRQQIDVDRVTGLRSRTWLTHHLATLLDSGATTEVPVAALLVDLREFESVRHALGFVVGDEVIGQIARELAALVPGGAELGRFSGDLLLMVVPGISGVVELSELADQIVRAVGRERWVHGKRMAARGFVGVALGVPGTSAETLLRDADLALNTAENAGERGWKIFDADDADGRHLLEVGHAIRVGLDNGEFVAWFQPQVQMYDGTVCGYEALVRWNHPMRGLVPPIEFIPAAERTGLINPLGQVVLEQACALLAARPDIASISVNVSPVQLAHEEWLASVRRVLDATGIEPHRLVLELTETAVFRLSDLARSALVELRDLGVGIQVDDFGTGFSAITNLRDLPLTGLKLDRSFVAALDDGDPGSLALVRGLAGLANGLGLETVAEGVETEAEAELLLEAGWTLAQGYLYGRPEPIVAVTSTHRPVGSGAQEAPGVPPGAPPATASVAKRPAARPSS